MSEESRVEDYAAPATQEPVRGKVKRRLHVYLVLGFAALAAPAIIWKATRDQAQQTDARKERKEAEAKEAVSGPPSLQPIQAEIEAQTRNAAESAGRTVDELKNPAGRDRATPPGQRDAAGRAGQSRPGAGPQGALLPLPAFMPGSQLRDPAELDRQQRIRDAEAEATRIKSSAILVLTAEGDGLRGSLPPGPQDLMASYNAAIAQATQRLAGQDPAKIAAAFAATQQQRPQSKVDLDRSWLSEQEQAKPPLSLAASRAASPYMVFQGTIIPAVLLTEVNSDLPGMLTAQVTLDVYDGIRGETLLIPKGSRLVGSYNNDVRPGQERVMAAFKRIIFPSGASVDLGAMAAADAIGRSGFQDEVDSHFWKQFGANFLVAGLAALISNRDSASTVTVVNSGGTAVSSAAGQILVDTVRNIQQRNAYIPPTIRINSGYKFNVLVNKDMTLPPQVTSVSLREGG